MLRLRVLPWEYGVRNLLRRPARSLLTLGALSTVVFLVLVIVGFVRGLEKSLAQSGDPAVVLVSAVGSQDSLETSSIAGRTPALLAASLRGIEHRFGVPAVSPELYLGTRVAAGPGERSLLGLVRGVTPAAPLVRRQVRIVEGRWPEPGEVLAGRLAAVKLGCRDEDLAVGRPVPFEGRTWRVSGRFSARATAFESELWCPLADLQQAIRRQDLSLTALLLAPQASASEVVLFCKERTDLELQAMKETDYYGLLQKHYRPVRVLAWIVAGLVAAAGIFAGLNTMYGAVAVRFTMGAFTLNIDGATVLAGCGTGLLLGVLGAVPPALRAMRLPVAEGLKAL